MIRLALSAAAVHDMRGIAMRIWILFLMNMKYTLWLIIGIFVFKKIEV